MLGPALDPNDPFSSMLMGGSDSFANDPYYSWLSGATQPIKPEHSPMHPSWNGMSATLAPSALDAAANDMPSGLKPSAPSMAGPMGRPSDGIDFNMSQESTNLKGMPPTNVTGLSRQSSGQDLESGPYTPGEGFWNSYVQDGSWGDEGGTT